MGKSKTFGEIGRALLLSAAVTILLLTVFAMILLWTGMDSEDVAKLLIAGYLLAPAAGGFFLGKRKKERRYLWGILIGVCYFILFALVSLTTQQTELQELLWTMLPMVVGGMAGGMLS